MTIDSNCLGAAAALVAILVASSGKGSQGNLVVNGDMELESNNTVSSWKMSKPPEAKCAISSVKAPIKEGTRALSLKGQGAWMSCFSEVIPVNSGAAYTAEAWIRVKQGHACVQLDYWEKEKWLGSTKAPERATKDEWTRQTLKSETGKYPTATHISVAITSDGPEVDIFVDEVSLTEKK
jgi:hypothetical protein